MIKKLFALVLILSLTACTPTPKDNNSSAPTSNTQKHSKYYIDNLTTEQLLQYFNEVVLDMEYSDGEGNITLVQKWTAPIYYKIHGQATPTDLEVLENFFKELNQIKGFPGIFPAKSYNLENLSIDFCTRATFLKKYSAVIGGEEDAFASTEFLYYTDTNQIHTAKIGCRTDIEQSERNSVLVEEIINALGISDTNLRKDSITYQNSNQNTSLTNLDWLIIKLLYNPKITCGMNKAECGEIIEKLYY